MEGPGGGGLHLLMNGAAGREVGTARADTGEPETRSGGSLSTLSPPRSLDPDQKDQLIEVIEKLLADKTTVGTGAHRVGSGEALPLTLSRLCPVPSWWRAAW